MAEIKFTKRLGRKNQITIPKDIISAYDIRPTDFLELDLIKVVKK